jgi:hypothetical protein
MLTSRKKKCHHEDEYILFTEKSKSDSSWAFFKIVEFLQLEKELVERKGIAAGTILNYVKAIKLFCEMTKIDTPLKRIMRELPRAKWFCNVICIIDKNCFVINKIKKMSYELLICSIIRELDECTKLLYFLRKYNQLKRFPLVQLLLKHHKMIHLFHH